MNYRRMELRAGILAGLTGLLGLGYALLGPTYGYERIELRPDGATSVTGGSASLIQIQSLLPITIAVFALMFLLVAGVSAGAYLHSRHRGRASRLLLGISTAVLGAGIVITGFGIGPSLVPAWLLALATAALADRVERQRGEPRAGPMADTTAGR